MIPSTGAKLKLTLGTRLQPATRRRLEALARRHHISLSAYAASILTAHSEGHDSCPGCRAQPVHKCLACGYGSVHNIARPDPGEE